MVRNSRLISVSDVNAAVHPQARLSTRLQASAQNITAAADLAWISPWPVWSCVDVVARGEDLPGQHAGGLHVDVHPAIRDCTIWKSPMGLAELLTGLGVPTASSALHDADRDAGADRAFVVQAVTTT